MEDLPMRPQPQSAPPPATIDETIPELENLETRREEALTVRYAIGKLTDFLSWFIAVLETTLVIRFLFRLIGADPGNLFAGFLYALTNIILFPFSTIVPASPLVGDRAAFELSTLIAMVIYYLIFWAVRRFLKILISTPEEPAS